MTKPKTKPARPHNSARRPFPLQDKNPGPQAISSLAALFNEGRYSEAATHAQAMTVSFPLHGFGWKVLGAAFKELGRLSDALIPMQEAAALSPGDAEAYSNLGVTLRSLGRLDEAEASCRRALKIKPDYADAHSNLGLTLKVLARLDEAEASYRLALQLKPDYVDAYSNLGVILKDLGRLDEAEASYRRALEIKPDFAEAHSNLGNVLKDLGRLDEAEASCRRALQIRPDIAEAHSNLGNVLNDLGRLDEAEASYHRAIQLKPDLAEPHNILALLFNLQGKSLQALTTINRSLQIKETDLAKSIFVHCIKHQRFSQDASDIRIALVRALTEPWGRPGDLARVGIDLVKLNPDIEGCVARTSKAWPLRLPAQELYGPNGPNCLARLASEPLLYALLNSVPICDIAMENFLTMVRAAMLDEAIGIKDSVGDVTPALRLYSALACQCFINEYVFSSTAEENQKAHKLRDSLVAALAAKAEVPALWPVAVAAYFPLCSLPFAARLTETQCPEEVKTVFSQQILEPEKERQLRATIPRLTAIEDEVSLSVQNQYEVNPYPRWIKIAPNDQPLPVGVVLRRLFPLVPIQKFAECNTPAILIAGCGTGQHSIGTAQRFSGARVLAIDLSMASLCYAKRKTRELDLAAIEYAQADILQLDSLGRSFDLIESVGVLHHLADPWAGWRVLLSLLRPGGFMKLGFYSELARRNIVRIRSVIAAQRYGATADEVRRCRQDLVDLDKSAHYGNTLQSPDFFSISTCRDLLFHVQEHRMTLIGIDAFLRENKLTFLGFEIDGHVMRTYKMRYPNDAVATNLEQWQKFENECPDTFAGMYQFWVQKTG